MTKWLTKLFCPSAKTLSGYAADGIAKAFNGSKDDLRMKVAKYSTYAQEVTRIADRLTAMVTDGTIDDVEKGKLQQMLEPVFSKALELV